MECQRQIQIVQSHVELQTHPACTKGTCLSSFTFSQAKKPCSTMPSYICAFGSAESVPHTDSFKFPVRLVHDEDHLGISVYTLNPGSYKSDRSSSRCYRLERWPHPRSCFQRSRNPFCTGCTSRRWSLVFGGSPMKTKGGAFARRSTGQY